MPIDVAKSISGVYEPNDAETYDEWFVRQVEEGLRETYDPATVWISNEDIFRELDERRLVWRAKADLQREAA
jgi:uncharacterized protein YfaT (DUF1175 family)